MRRILNRQFRSIFRAPFTTLHRSIVYAPVNGPSAATHIYTYDVLSRLSTVTDGSYSATHSYTPNSMLISSITFKQSGVPPLTTTKTYDNLNRLQSITSVPGTGKNLSFQYGYNAANQRVRVSLADGSYWLYSYDSYGQIVSGKRYWPDGTPIAGQQFDYGFDQIGNRQWTKSGGDSQGGNMRLADYSADVANQYTSRDVSGTVDVLGVADARSTVTVNSQNAYRKGEYFDHALTFANTSAALYPGITNSATFSGSTDSTNGFIFIPKTPEVFIHDYDGNLTSDGRWNYTWDGENRLVKLESRNTTPTNSWRRLTFAYDSNGRRIRKTVQLANPNGTWGTTVVSNLFVYDGWNLKLELNATNKSVIRTYMWGADLSGSLEGAGGVGGLLEIMIPQSGRPYQYFPAYDGNGNIVGLVSSGGSVVANYEYGPFGEVIRATGPMAKANPFRFSTKYQDDESDLVYYGYRYYNPSTGRWPNRDPIGEQGGINLYGFVFNDTINRIDFLGLQSNVIGIPAMIEAGWTAADIAEVAGISILAAEALIAAKRAKRCGKWSCFSKGDVVPIGGTTGLPDHVAGFGSGATQTEACQAAKKMASNSSPQGSYARHIRCYGCVKQ